MLCKRTVKNQITLPKKIADKFKGIEYFNVEVKENIIVMMPVRIESAVKPTLGSIRNKIAKLGITESDIENAIQSVRHKNI